MEQLIAGPPAWFEWDEARWYRNRKGYYQDRTGSLLHIAVWERSNRRPLPDGYVIHHRDHDPANNDITNLGCLTEAEHNAQHSQEGQQHPRWLESQSSEAWQERTLTMWRDRKARDVVCAECGTTYQSTGMRAKFCDRNCAARYRRRQRRERSVTG